MINQVWREQETKCLFQDLANVEGHCVEIQGGLSWSSKIVREGQGGSVTALTNAWGSSLSYHTRGQVKFQLKFVDQTWFLTCRQVTDYLAKG